MFPFRLRVAAAKRAVAAFHIGAAVRSAKKAKVARAVAAVTAKKAKVHAFKALAAARRLP